MLTPWLTAPLVLYRLHSITGTWTEEQTELSLKLCVCKYAHKCEQALGWQSKRRDWLSFPRSTAGTPDTYRATDMKVRGTLGGGHPTTRKSMV